MRDQLKQAMGQEGEASLRCRTKGLREVLDFMGEPADQERKVRRFLKGDEQVIALIQALIFADTASASDSLKSTAKPPRCTTKSSRI